MLLHIMLGVQALLTMAVMPNGRITGEDMKNNTRTHMQPAEPTGDDLTTMMPSHWRWIRAPLIAAMKP